MAINDFGKIQEGRRKRLKKRITWLIAAAVIILAAAAIIGVLTSKGEGYTERVTLLEENHKLKEQISALEEQVTALQGQVTEKDAYIASIPTEAPASPAPSDGATPTADDQNDQSPRDDLQ